ncbi:MAG: response regulator [Pseudomonadota bacterium]
MPKKITILIADDEESIIDLLKDRFEYEGLNVLTAISGTDALSMLKQNTVDLILSDYRMPNGDGMSILDELKKYPEKERPPFYFMSAYADISEDHALEAGAKKFYHKPFSVSSLIKDVMKEIDQL